LPVLGAGGQVVANGTRFFPISHEVDGLTEPAAEGVWMWLRDAAPAPPPASPVARLASAVWQFGGMGSAAGESGGAEGDGEGAGRQCGAIVVLDSSGIGGSLGGLARRHHEATELARRRLLAFLLLTSSRLVLNSARQPSETLMEQLGGAVAATRAWQRWRGFPPPALPDVTRPWTAAGALPPPTAPEAPEAEAAPEEGRMPIEAARAADAEGNGSSGAGGEGEAGQGGGQGGGQADVELVVLIRDASLGMRSNDAPLSEREVIDRWVEGLEPPTPSALRTTFPSPQLIQLAPPAEIDLRLMADESQPLPASRFGAALQRVASNLTAYLRPVDLPGEASVEGIEVITRWLNSQSCQELDEW